MSRRHRMLEALAIGPVWLKRGQNSARAGVTSVVQDVSVDTAGVDQVIAPNRSSVSGATGELLPPALRSPGAPGQHSDAEIALMDWKALQSAVSTCTRCDLCTSRTRTVFGVGDPKAQWLFVGEGPGRNEDLQGEPFVGPAGRLLDNMLAAIDLRRTHNAFIANVVKCRPTDANGKDRMPNAQEVAACRPYLARQIALVQPSIVVALGKIAAVALLERDSGTPVSSLRGVVHRYGDLPLVVTYHPAYLLRALVDKRKSWEDLCLAVDTHASAG